jgi:hypothetical protein
MAIKPFIATPKTHQTLVFGYLRFPELKEVFQNIVKDEELDKGVLSGWDKETMHNHIHRFMLPLLAEAGAIRADMKTKCGYVTDYTDLIFDGIGAVSWANLCATRALQIAQTVRETDTKENAIFADLHFKQLPSNFLEELLSGLRSFLGHYLTEVSDNSVAPENSTDEGKAFRLVLLARSETNEITQEGKSGGSRS